MFYTRKQYNVMITVICNIHLFYFQFMQRSALQIEKEKSEEEKQKVIDDEHWVLDLPETEHKE